MVYKTSKEAYTEYIRQSPKKKPYILKEQEEIISLIYDNRLIRLTISKMLPHLSFTISNNTLRSRLKELVDMRIVEKRSNNGKWLLDAYNKQRYHGGAIRTVCDNNRDNLLNHALIEPQVQDVINELLPARISFLDIEQTSKDILAQLSKNLSSKLDFYIKVIMKLVDKGLFSPSHGYSVLQVNSYATKYGLPQSGTALRIPLVRKKNSTIEDIMHEIEQ